MLHNPERSSSRARRAVRVVAIGGGTGLSTLLKGLKRYTVTSLEKPPQSTYISDLTAVVTVSDDGGSSGRLRRELKMLPPGDIRNCLVALSEILAARGHILPATSANVELEAIMNDGSRVRGETKITASERRIVELTMVPAHPEPLPQTLEAIAAADIITIGPGSLFTSLIPNLLVRGVPEAITSSRAVKVFVCNLMTEANESLSMSASDHIMAIYAHAGHGLFNYALVNSAPVSDTMRERYAAERAEPVECDGALIEALGVTCLADNFLEERETVRHATDRVCRGLLRIAQSAVLQAQAAQPALR
jgi:2-phospho-L-lactate transferase/gluconeogenesis factor (CofD/UPF0052 family)